MNLVQFLRERVADAGPTEFGVLATAVVIAVWYVTNFKD